MNILFIGDPHLKITRFELAKEFLAWVNETIKQQEPDLVINLGDTFDTHGVVRSEIMTEFVSHVHEAIKTTKYVYLLGNHDMFKPNDAKYHALLHLKDTVPGFIIIDEITHGPWGMSWVPYQHDHTKFPTKTQDICIAHQTFKGADYGDITTKDGVDPESVSAEVIISGHIHKKQTLGKVIYPGSPFSQGVNDINQIKGLMLFDTQTYKQEFIHCPLPKWQGQRYELSSAYTCQDLHADISQLLKDTKDHWVIEIEGPKAELTAYLSNKETIALLKPYDVKIKTVFTDKVKKLTSIKGISVDSIVKEYIDKVYDGALNREVLYSKAVESLGKV